MLDGPPKTPAEFAVEAINVTKDNVAKITTNADGTPRDLDVTQAVAAAQLVAINAIAASLLAIADAIRTAR